MEFVFKIPIQEANEEVFSSLQKLIKRFKSGEITISFREKSAENNLIESSEEYEKRLLNSISSLDEGSGISFTPDSLKAYVAELVKQ